MTTPPAAPIFHRRARLSVVRDLLVAGLALLVVAGFLFGVGGGVRDPRPAPAQRTSLSS
jgi:hypothetical protein